MRTMRAKLSLPFAAGGKAAESACPTLGHAFRVKNKNAGQARAVGLAGGRDRPLSRPRHHGESGD